MHPSFAQLEVLSVPENVASAINPCDSCVKAMRYFPRAVNISRISGRICPASLFVISPIFAAFEEVSFFIAFPGENCVHVCQIHGDAIASYSPGVSQGSSVAVLPEPFQNEKKEMYKRCEKATKRNIS